MGFVRAGFRSDTNLKDHEGDLIALRYSRIINNVLVNIPANEVTGEAARSEVQNVLSADLYVFGPTGATGKLKGQTLVFQQMIAQELTGRPDDWHIGVLTRTAQRSDESRSVYTLEAPSKDPDRTFDAAEKLLTESGLA